MAVSAITDFRIQVSLFTNRKFRRLRSALGPGACMALVELWGYAATNEPDGALLGWSSDDVEVAANWDGIRGVFTQHLVDLHWLDPAEGGGYLIHDWAENQPWIADAPKRSAHAKKAIDTRWARERARREADGNDQNTAGIPAEYSENTPFLSSPLLPSPPPPTPRKRGGLTDSPDSLPGSLFPGGEERLSSGESASKKKKAASAEKPDPWGWDEFAAVYPGFRLKPDRACKAWFGKNIRDRATLDRLLDSVRAWLRSEQWIGGVVPNCSKFCDEGIWLAEPGPPPRGSVQARQEDNRAAMAGAARILGFDKEVPNDAS